MTTKSEAVNIGVMVPFLMKSSSTPLQLGLRALFTLLDTTYDQAHCDGLPAAVASALQGTGRAGPQQRCIGRHDARRDFGLGGEERHDETTKEKQRRYVYHIFQNETLPHIGMDQEPETLQEGVLRRPHGPEGRQRPLRDGAGVGP